MKLLIASTPKMGNTWLRYLLAVIYDLPMPQVGAEFNPNEFDKLGPCWVSQQHYYPQSKLLNWTREQEVTVFTVVRHPCDVLISLYHYVSNYEKDELGKGFGLESELIKDEGSYSEHTKSFVKDTFYWLLNVSVSWIHSRHSQVVRYEDLWRDPVTTLIDLTSRLRPVSVEKIERAVEKSNISVLRRLDEPNSKFFRQGSVGHWRESLPPDIVDLFRTLDPYPAQFAALGYTLDFDDPLMAAPAKPRPSSVGEITHFDNGMMVPAVVVNLFLSFDSSTAKLRWPDFAKTSPESFFAWLNDPAEDDPFRDTAPCITNLGTHLRSLRADVASEFHDPFGNDRIRFIHWLLNRAQTEYHLDLGFIAPIFDSFVRWAGSPAAGNTETRGSVPMLTNFAIYVYRRNPDLQKNILMYSALIVWTI